jgi:Ala-tRNA(Pro) deacylase
MCEPRFQVSTTKEITMALDERLQQFLDGQRAPYRIIPHREVFTAHDTAKESQVSDRQLAKVVLVRKEESGHYLMVVLPASCRADLVALRDVADAHKLRLATEDEVGRLFPDCELGAMSPFGNLYGLPVYIDRCFGRAEDLFFQAGNHHEVVTMRYGDYERLVKPVVGEFCLHERESELDG